MTTSAAATSLTQGSPVLQAGGIGSGLDVQGIVSKLVAAEINPLQQQITSRQSTLNGEVSAFGTLSSSLSSLETALSSLMDSTAFQQKAATSSATGFVTATADSTAALGSYNVQVTQLAAQQKVRLSTGVASTSTALNWSGTLTINSGTFTPTSAGATTGSFATSGTSFNVSIASTDTLTDVQNKINAAGAGVTATIVNDGTNNYLNITSNSTGASNAFSITGTATDGTNTFAFNPDGSATTAVTAVSQAYDGVALIDGLSTSSSTNTITGAVQGVTFSLAGLGTSTVSVGADTAATKGTITKFVDAYNNVINTINNLSKYVQGGTSGPLLSDSMVAGLKNKLQSIMGGASTNTGVFQTLTQLGYSTDPTNGTLSLTTPANLDNALASNFNDVGTMMADYATQVNSLVSAYTGSIGLIQGRTDSLNTMLKGLQDQQDQLTLRQQSLTQTYTKQYSALDASIATMNSTMSYLSQQLAKLPG